MMTTFSGYSRLDELFSKAYVLGGSPCSGKSTLAELINRDFAIRLYKVDDYENEHMRRIDAELNPVMLNYLRMSWDEIWMRPVEQQVGEEFNFYRERFGMILRDLQQFDPKQPLLMEGAAFLPELISCFPIRTSNVIFMVPSWDFQVDNYSQRPWAQRILDTCSDPEQAFENWMKRDYQFGKRIIQQASKLKYRVIIVDGTISIQELFNEVCNYFGLGSETQTAIHQAE